MESKTIRFEKSNCYWAEEVHHFRELFTKVKNRDDDSDNDFYYFPIKSFTVQINIIEDAGENI